MTTRLFCAFLTTLSLSPLGAQHQFLEPFGVPLAVTTFPSLTTVSLGHPFTMPGGSTVTQIDIDSQGRIRESGVDSSDFSETVNELLNETGGTIMARWDFLSFPSTSNADVFFDTDANRSLISWVNAEVSGEPPSTTQAQLWADGRIVFVYDNRMPDNDGIVGVSPGGGVANPGRSNLSDSVSTPIVSSGSVLYEDFGFFLGVTRIDLAGHSLEFLPNGPGGLNGWTVIGNTGVIDRNPSVASVTPSGRACYESRTFVFAPAAGGGFTVSALAAGFDGNLGQELPFASNNSVVTGIDLGFVFPFPGGAASRFVDVDSNGRVFPVGGSVASDPTPSVAEFQSDGRAKVCLWTDFNPATSESDGVYFNSQAGVASFTWNNVAQFGAGAIPLTTQIRLFQDGTIFLTLEDMVGFNAAGHASPDDILIGVTDGASATAEIDLSTLMGLPAGVSAFEFWDTDTGAEAFDFAGLSQPRLVSLSTPSFGGNWDLQIRNMPATSTFGFLLFGFVPLDDALDVLGIAGCSLQVLDAGFPVVLGRSGGVSTVNSIAIPTEPDLVGLTLFVQGGSDGAPFSPFPVWIGNAIAGTVGAF